MNENEIVSFQNKIIEELSKHSFRKSKDFENSAYFPKEEKRVVIRTSHFLLKLIEKKGYEELESFSNFSFDDLIEISRRFMDPSFFYETQILAINWLNNNKAKFKRDQFAGFISWLLINFNCN